MCANVMKKKMVAYLDPNFILPENLFAKNSCQSFFSFLKKKKFSIFSKIDINSILKIS